MTSCMWCHNDAAFACDAVIGMKAMLCPGSGREPGPRIVFESWQTGEVYRCDAPICGEHRHQVGNLFVCGENGYGDSVDHCPYCAKYHPEAVPMLREDAERLRRLRHAEIRRTQFRQLVSG